MRSMSLLARLDKLLRPGPRVHVLRLAGPIGLPGRPGLSDEGVADAAEAAFSGNPSAVALAINSPGGLPVQSALIAARIRRLAERETIPVFAFCEDMAASGGYWLACAADEIHADPSSLVGSIGVITASFGAHEALGRLGLERRVHATGDRKLILDPFQPERPEDVEDLRAIQADILAAFLDHVRTRRGDRLKVAPESLGGALRTGRRALEEGLVDGLGHLVPVMKARFGDRTRFRVFAPRRGLLTRLGVSGAAAAATEGALDALEARLRRPDTGV